LSAATSSLHHLLVVVVVLLARLPHAQHRRGQRTTDCVPRGLVGDTGLAHPIVLSPEGVVTPQYADRRRLEDGLDLHLPKRPLVPV